MDNFSHDAAETTDIVNAVPLFDLQSSACKVLISLEREKVLRDNAFRQLSELGLEARWKIPRRIEDIDWQAIPSIYRRNPKYASRALTLLEIFGEVQQRSENHFMLFEDDIVFHSDFISMVHTIFVPSDWKFVYVGGRNNGKKHFVSKGLVRSTFICDLHAVIIRTDMIDLLKRMLLDERSHTYWTDHRIACLHKDYPAYLCRPNLTWQSAHSDGSGGPPASNYNEDGSVKNGQGN